MKIPLGELARVVGASSGVDSALVSGWSIDSRTLQPGDLFFALRGPNHDGHDYVAVAVEKGAVAAVVERPLGPKCLVVENTLAALQRAAAWARGRWSGTMIAVTGSAGKTTTKDVIAHLLAAELKTGKTIGNLNNHYGVPLSILRLPDNCQAAVLEIAMNHPGEIRVLAAIARPEIGVVTNVGHAHAEYFNSIEGVAAAKRELIESLPPDGVAVLNADDPRVLSFRQSHPGRSVTFGLSEGADVRARDIELTADGARFTVCGTRFDSSLAGRHGISNMLAGIAVAQLFGIMPQRLRDAVRLFAPGAMRGQRIEHAGIVIWNDCYNSNPEAARAMLDVLKTTPATRRVAVLGEMLELGDLAETLHRELGRYVAGSGIDVLVGIQGAAKHMVEEAARAGMRRDSAYFFPNPVAAGEFLKRLLGPGDAVLFKGSRAVQVERAMETVLA